MRLKSCCALLLAALIGAWGLWPAGGLAEDLNGIAVVLRASSAEVRQCIEDSLDKIAASRERPAVDVPPALPRMNAPDPAAAESKERMLGTGHSGDDFYPGPG